MSMQYKTTAMSVITSVRQNARDMNNNAHVALCNATVHAVLHGDVTLFDRIGEALGKGADRKALLEWCKDVGCASWSKETNSFQLVKARRKALGIAFDKSDDLLSSLLEGTPWHEYGKTIEEHARTFDPVKLLESICKRYDNAVANDEGKVIMAENAKGQVEAIRELAAKLKMVA